VLFSQSGVTAVVEETQRRAVLLAIDEVNASGGIEGREIVTAQTDPRSDPRRFGTEAASLVASGVRTIFGCYMSSARRAVLPIVERGNALLFYPTLYEGFEFSPNCIYSGAAPNQNSIVLADYLMKTYGDRFYSVGSNYIFPYESNRIMRDLIQNRGGTVVDERYIPLVPDAEAISTIIDEIARLTPTIVFSTVVGDGATALYRAYDRAGFDRTRMPIGSLTTGEPEIAAMGPDAGAGHITSAPYFCSIDTPENRRFVAAFRARYGPEAPISACTEAAYFQVHMFAQAARLSGSTKRQDILAALAQIRFDAPQGRVEVDWSSHHTYLTPRVARASQSGIFEIAYEAEHPLRPDPYMVEPSGETPWEAVRNRLVNR
jgi:branched-chain amino acid transport system substrate-binding protein